VMKFIEGRTLKNLLSGKPLTLEQILDVMTPVAGALTYAHHQGVLHRDIKPSNIILDRNGVPYLTDFGLARMAQAGESTMSQDMMLGTPQYISPEQARGEKSLDARTDIYSLGIVLYELVVGRVPFNADTPYAIVHEHIYSRLPPPSQINPEIPQVVENVLFKALAKNPDDRYVSAVEMMDSLRQAVVESGLTGLSPDRGTARQGTIPPADFIGLPTPPTIPPLPHAGRRKVRVERSFDAGEVDFGDIGRKIEEGVRQGVGALGSLAFSVQEAIAQREAAIPEEERIRRRIEKRYKERQGLIIHFTSYLLVNLMLWAIWATTKGFIPQVVNDPNIPPGTFEFPWPMFVTIATGSRAFWMKSPNVTAGCASPTTAN